MPRTPSRPRTAFRRLAAYAVFACALGVGGVAPVVAAAAPDSSANARIGAVTTRIGADTASLIASSPAIVAGRSFGYSASLGLTKPADSVRFRIRVWRPTGRLIFQRTRIMNDVDPGALTASFERTTDDLDLRPGAYPVEVEVSVVRGGVPKTVAIATKLLVHDGSGSVPVSLVAHVGGQPLSDSNGRFVADPERFTRARDDVNALASWVLTHPRARVTLAVSPLLLEEWQRISGGYELAGPEGLEQVTAESQVARDYAGALALLSNAIATGRLELAAQGYADPDLSDLEGAGLLGDIVPQYERGLSAIYASLEATPSTGTVPAGGCVPPASARLLSDAGVRYTVVDSGCARSGDATAASSAYRTGKHGLIALVADEYTSEALASGDTSTVVGHAFDRLVGGSVTGPMVFSAELGAGGTDVETLTAAYDALCAQPWIRPALAREVARAPKGRTVTLVASSGTKGDPAGYWQDVARARQWAGALVAATGESTDEAVTAQRDALIAECSAWAGTDGSWALADRGRTFAATAERLATRTLGKVTLAIEPVTLSGTEGGVPVTIMNASGKTLKLRLKLTSTKGVRVGVASKRTLDLGPKETFIQVPIRLANVLDGDLNVTLSAGDVVLDQATVTIRASYLDRIALIAGIILALAGMLAFIIRRVRMAELLQPDGATRDEAYTGQAMSDRQRRS